MVAKLQLIHRQERCVAGVNINEVRGFAAILVVAFHAVASEPALTNTIWGYAVASFVFVRMPLFIAVSGYLYGAQRTDRPLSFVGWQKRIRRIAPPFLLGTIVCWVMSAPTDHSFNLWAGLAFGAWHLWYLQALALILLFVAVLDTYVRPSNSMLWLWAAVAFVIASAKPLDGVTWLSLNRALYLLPHFLAGAAVGAMPKIIDKRSTRLMIYICGASAFFAQQLSLLSYIAVFSKTSIPAALIGFAAFVFIVRHLGTNSVLRCVGSYSFPIYLWHLPASSLMTALILRYTDIDAQLAVLIKIIVGVTLPVVISIWCSRYAPYVVTFVGGRAVSKILRNLDADTAQTDLQASPQFAGVKYNDIISQVGINPSVITVASGTIPIAKIERRFAA